MDEWVKLAVGSVKIALDKHTARKLRSFVEILKTIGVPYADIEMDETGKLYVSGLPLLIKEDL